MSGLEGLAALGLACSIFQVISFGRETLSQVKDVYRNGILDASLMDKSIAIQRVASDIVAVNVPQLGKQERKLVDVTKKCTGVARDLQEEIAFLVGHNGRGSLGATLKIAAKANWRKRRLERMEKDLAESEQLMQSALLAWIFKSSNTASINIDSLRQDLRNFVVKYQQGSRQASELIYEEALQVREVVVKESQRNKEALETHVTRTSANFEQNFERHIKQNSTQLLRDKILKSLKFPGMNERTNEIQIAHAHTFRWLFADGDDDEDEEGPPAMPWYNFTHWLLSDLNFYWIMGKPGSGKSTLTKFILSSPRTETALERWRCGTVIVSHFFWRPGSPMQQSIKGMLCSLIYQLVLLIPDAVEYTSANVTRLNQKDAETDWTVPELQQLFSGLVSHCDKPLCLFIDGLDECGPEDDQQEVLELLDRIRLIPNVKIIASSRDEPVFEEQFRHEPQLRVQDLTAEDLRTYARDMLPQDIRGYFLRELVEKAEGVFLWLVLAIKSIKRGLRNTESLADLRDRVKRLPTGLGNLYKDMWARLNEDGELYQETAALYFKLVIAAHDRRLVCVPGRLSALEMMLASLPRTHSVFTERPSLLVHQLLKDCEDFKRRVGVRCAGLLSLSESPRQVPKTSTESLREKERALIRYSDGQLAYQFIHRSAHDFLVDTISGQDILRHDRTSPIHIEIMILRARLRTIQVLISMLGEVEKGTEWFSIRHSQELVRYLHDLSYIAQVEDHAARELFSLCYELFCSTNVFTLPKSIRSTRMATFFGLVADFPNLVRYSTSIIQNKCIGSDTRSAILLSMASPTLTFRIRHTLYLELVQWCLSLPKFDVNLKCPLIRIARERSYGHKFEEISPLDHIMVSPFERVLGQALLWIDWQRDVLIQDRYNAAQFLRLAAEFVFHGADLRSTLFLSFSPKYIERASSLRPSSSARFCQVLDEDFSPWRYWKHMEDNCLGIVVLQASTIIRKMLASLPIAELGHHSSGKANHGSEEADKAISFLSQKCQEFSCEANDRVIGFLQPCGSFIDMPYRQVSEQDSAHLMGLVWTCIFEDGEPAEELENSCTEVLLRSPFSGIGFKDYMKETGCFDELAAQELALED